MIEYQQTILSQYSNSPIITQIIANLNSYIDPSANFEDFYNLIWNLDTAVGYGLDVWGRIVGVNRVLTIRATPDNFGFQDGTQDFAPFGQAPFYDGQAVTQNYALSDDVYRTLILVKAAANISACDPPSLNSLLNTLFAGRGRCYVNDYGHMLMRYTFEFYLQPFEYAILTQAAVLPNPTGVGVSVLQAPTDSLFGFSANGVNIGWTPFGEGSFLSENQFASLGLAPPEPYQGSGSIVGVDYISG